MKELELKYGCNPNQKPSRIYMEEGELPIQVLNGKPGYINFLDAFNGWQLVSELKKSERRICICTNERGKSPYFCRADRKGESFFHYFFRWTG